MLVKSDQPLREALQTIDYNAQGVCFIVDPQDGQLVGVLTDGDIRRALLKGANLETVTSEVMQKKFLSLSANSPIEVIQQKLGGRCTHIPLVDATNKPVDYACPHRFRRIQVAQPSLNGNELAYVTDCIRTNWISSQGGYVQRFEQMFREYCKVPHALAVANGTVALHLGLEALGIGPGDEVIVPNFTFAASVNAVLYTGATPVLVDIRPDTWVMDLVAARKLITKKTKAIMPVHLYGYPCDMDGLAALAREHGLFVVEDCAEALGSQYKGNPVGSFGDVSMFSFFGNKTITTGEGGMVTFKDKAVFERATVLRDHGMSKSRRYWHEVVGYNYRLTNIQAAIGVAQMERIDDLVASKRAIGAAYTKAFADIKGITTPFANPDIVNSFWLYTVLINEQSHVSRDELIEKLLFNGIETRAVFFPIHEMPPYQRFAASTGYPVTERISRQGLSLPSAVSLSAEEVENVCETVRSISSRRGLGRT